MPTLRDMSLSPTPSASRRQSGVAMVDHTGFMDNEKTPMNARTAQERADEADCAAIERYLALRAAFWPCWGRPGGRKETR